MILSHHIESNQPNACSTSGEEGNVLSELACFTAAAEINVSFNLFPFSKIHLLVFSPVCVRFEEVQLLCVKVIILPAWLGLSIGGNFPHSAVAFLSWF